MNYAENEDAKCITVAERGPLNDLLCNAADSVKEAKRLREENAALLAEVAALRERLTLTEDVLVKAQAAFMEASAFCDWQEGVRAALLAAGMEEAR